MMSSYDMLFNITQFLFAGLISSPPLIPKCHFNCSMDNCTIVFCRDIGFVNIFSGFIWVLQVYVPNVLEWLNLTLLSPFSHVNITNTTQFVIYNSCAYITELPRTFLILMLSTFFSEAMINRPIYCSYMKWTRIIITTIFFVMYLPLLIELITLVYYILHALFFFLNK
jgi:hypothetical protein